MKQQRISRCELCALPPLLSMDETRPVTGLGRSATYEAARTGFLPTVQVSQGRMMVPTHELLRRLRLLEEGGYQSCQGCRYAAFTDHTREDDRSTDACQADHHQVCQTDRPEGERHAAERPDRRLD